MIPVVTNDIEKQRYLTDSDWHTISLSILGNNLTITMNILSIPFDPALSLLRRYPTDINEQIYTDVHYNTPEFLSHCKGSLLSRTTWKIICPSEQQ